MKESLWRFFLFCLALFLLPTLYAVVMVSIDFCSQLSMPGAKTSFTWGALSYLIVYLFILEPIFMYKAPEKVTEKMDSVFEPIIKGAPYLFPIYTVGAMVLYFIFRRFGIPWVSNFFLFIIGFSFVFHVLFASRMLKERFKDGLDPHYLFLLIIIILVNILIATGGVALSSPSLKYSNYIGKSKNRIQHVYVDIYNQLFLRTNNTGG